MPTTYIGGSNNVLTLINEHSSKMFAYFLKTKGQVKDAITKFITTMEKQTGKKFIC